MDFKGLAQVSAEVGDSRAQAQVLVEEQAASALSLGQAHQETHEVVPQLFCAWVVYLPFLSSLKFLHSLTLIIERFTLKEYYIYMINAKILFVIKRDEKDFRVTTLIGSVILCVDPKGFEPLTSTMPL